MREVAIALAVLFAGLILGALLKPTEAELSPLSPDAIGGAGAGHAEEPAHHH